MDGFDVALVGVGGGRDALMLGAEESDGAGEAGAGAIGFEGADELAAVIGLPDEVGKSRPQRCRCDWMRWANRALAPAERWWAKARNCKPLRTSRAVYWTAGQAAGLHLGPIVRDIVEVLGVGGDLLAKPPGGFQRRQVLLLLVLAAAGMDQAVLCAGCAGWPYGGGADPTRACRRRAPKVGKLAPQGDDVARPTRP